MKAFGILDKPLGRYGMIEMNNSLLNKIDSGFWQNKKVFLTGCTGFKGSWLSLILLNLGANLKGYSLEPETQPSLFDICELNKHSFWTIGDIRDKQALEKQLVDFQPEIIIHMAAQALVLRSYENPIETYETNVMGTANLLESCRSVSSVKAILNITTDKCYENKEWSWGYRENDELGGYDPYSSSKACAELITKAFTQSFFNPEKYEQHGICLASARAGNVIGGGDWANNRLIPDAAKSFSEGKELVIRCPASTRPWQHVLEPLRGYLMLCEKMYKEGGNYSGAFNFGPSENNVCTVKEAIDEFVRLWGEDAAFKISDSENSLYEAGLLKLDISKVQKHLGWKPQLNFSETLKITADWYKFFYSGNLTAIKDFTLKQISENL